MSPTPTKHAAKSYLAAFLKDRHVAALSPSSPHVIRRVLNQLDLPEIRTIVELGPARGAATKPILAGLGPTVRYLAIETNPDFVRELRTLEDQRLTVVEGDARRLRAILAERGLGAVDAVIASIPFSHLTPKERRELVATVRAALKPDGTFVIFHQYSRLMLPYVKKEFSQVKAEFEPLNVFPCFIIEGRP